MTYTAPAILTRRKAIRKIQDLVEKIGLPTDNAQPSASSAYQADE